MEPIKQFQVQGSFLVEEASDFAASIPIRECETQSEFEVWKSTWSESHVAALYTNTIYVKVPLRLDEYGEFCLDHNVLPVAEANSLIRLWNERYKNWLEASCDEPKPGRCGH